ncbi:hypothetical protein GGI07_000634 [Coemansia sp. Benny D115]|nr:hypothetical protein GGI07_000634 [Coemansia sp. Benny D115]
MQQPPRQLPHLRPCLRSRNLIAIVDAARPTPSSLDGATGSPHTARMTSGEESKQRPQAPAYPPIKPRGDPDKHRQAMAEENELKHNQVLIERRQRNTQAAARMRERQKEREKSLLQRRDVLVSQMSRLEAELAAIRAQRQQSEESTFNEEYEELLHKLSAELEAANNAMHAIMDEVEKLVDIVKALDV